MGYIFIGIGLMIILGAVGAFLELRERRNRASEIEPAPMMVTDPSYFNNQKAETIYTKERTYPVPPKAPFHKIASYVGGVLLILASVFGLFLGSPQILIISLGGIAGGIILLIAGARADQREAMNMASRAEVIIKRVDAETQLTNLELARDNAELQRRVKTETTITQIGQQKLAQQQVRQQGTELELRVQYIPQAAEKGVDVDSLIQLNMQESLNKLEVEKTRDLNAAENLKEWEQVQNWLKASNLVALSVGQQRKQLTIDYMEAIDKIIETKRKRMPRAERTRVLDLLEKSIQQIEADLDGLKAERLIQTTNGQAVRRLEEPSTQARPDYPESVDADDH